MCSDDGHRNIGKIDSRCDVARDRAIILSTRGNGARVPGSVKIIPVVHSLFLQIRKKEHIEAMIGVRRIILTCAWFVRDFLRRGKLLVNIVEKLKGQTNLLEIVVAFRPPRRFARRLYGGQQERDQDSDDRDYDQQFDQRKATGCSRSAEPRRTIP